MNETTSNARAPWHLWVVGIVSLFWNGFGAYDFVMSVTQREAYFRASGMTDAMIAYYEAMPAWMYAPWIVGVWGAVVGSILLLARSRFAVPTFGASLVGAVVSMLYGFLDPMPPLPPELAVMKYMSVFIVVIASLLLAYAWRARGRDVLR